MKLKKLLLQLGLLLSFIGFGSTSAVIAFAQTGTDLQSDEAKAAGVLDQTPNFIDGDSKEFRTSYPSVNEISADGVKNGRVTTSTKHIYISYDTRTKPTISTSYWSTAKYTKFYADVSTYVGGTVKSLNTGSPQLWSLSSDSKTATPPSGVVTIPVDFSRLGVSPAFPIYIGFNYDATNGYGTNITNYYKELTITGNNAAVSALRDVTINDGKDLPSSNTTISGTAQAGMTVTLTGLTGSEDSYTQLVGVNNTYSFDLNGQTIKSLGNPKSVKVTESNEFGDTKSATANVTDTVPLTITSGTPSLTVSPDDWDAHIAGKSSSEIATWIASQTGMTATKPDGTTPSTLAYDTTDGDSLKATVAGGTQDVAMNVSDADGNASTTPATISVTRGAGKLQFGDMTNMVFGNGATLPIPGQKTLYAPGDYQINISDTREMGSSWYVTANATPMTATDGSHRTLSGHIVYEDGNGTRTQLDSGNAVPVAAGKRDSNSTDIAKSWNQDGKSYDGSSVPAGVYLDANPNIYAAGGATGYSGNITWSLTDAPGN